MSDAADRKRRAVWQTRLREFDRGNFTVVEFCRQAGVSVPSFYLWRRKLKPAVAVSKARSQVVPAVSFLPVEITSGGRVEVLLPGGVRVLVPSHDQQALRTVISTLLTTTGIGSSTEERAC